MYTPRPEPDVNKLCLAISNEPVFLHLFCHRFSDQLCRSQQRLAVLCGQVVPLSCCCLVWSSGPSVMLLSCVVKRSLRHVRACPKKLGILITPPGSRRTLALSLHFLYTRKVHTGQAGKGAVSAGNHPTTTTRHHAPALGTTTPLHQHLTPTPPLGAKLPMSPSRGAFKT